MSTPLWDFKFSKKFKKGVPGPALSNNCCKYMYLQVIKYR